MFPEELQEATVCVWGLGLMGGSLALALQPHCKSIVGIDHQPAVVERAVAEGVVSQASTEPQAILTGIDILVLAVPVGAIVQIISRLPDLCRQPLVVLDLGSTKTGIVRAFKNLPGHIYPVAGHPMCGKAVLGLENAAPNIYQRAPFMLHPLPHSKPRAFGLIEQLVRAIGAVPVILEPEVHDRWVAGTSHLPYLVACALALSVPTEAAPMTGRGYASATRLAQTPTTMMLDVVETNRNNLVEFLRDFQAKIEMLTAHLEAGEMDTLEGVLNEAAVRRERIISEAQIGGEE